MRADRRIAREIALKVIRDHGYNRHINEFKKDGIVTRGQMMDHIISQLTDPNTQMIVGGKGETLFYNKSSNTFICDNHGHYKSTCFKAKDGIAYFNAELERVQRDRSAEKLPPAKMEAVNLEAARQEHEKIAVAKEEAAKEQADSPSINHLDRMLQKLDPPDAGAKGYEKDMEFEKDEDYERE
ncbi:MAG: hypothetical protein JSS82_08175 [Bacteroidetes bacterium]|nr:hypothetical protein [Bacteroidota bacterium]